jgi:hypothetical protein
MIWISTGLSSRHGEGEQDMTERKRWWKEMVSEEGKVLLK